jgi:demethylmenaquinone methyltransferase/2-methoxy-6-polyprenyl-1,4-benzoquinol methylase
MDIFATAETKRLYNRELFREVAPRYDLVTRILSFGRDAAWKRALISRLSSENVHRILDLACGTGDLTRALAVRFPDAEVTGLDLTPEMLARASGNDRIVWKQGDMCDTGLPDGSIDLVTGGYALRNAPDLDTALDEIHRVLRPGGELAVLDFSASSRPLFRALHFGLLMFWGSLWGLLLHGKPSV